MSKSKPTSHLKLHSSVPEEFKQWSAVIELDGKPLTLSMMQRTFGMYGGLLCGRCEKVLEKDEGKYRTIEPNMYVPGLGDMSLPPRLSQYKYCPTCFEALENDGKAKLEIVKEE